MQIVLPLLILLIGLGAWRAWRRSPVYSLKINIQLAGVFLLMVAAIVSVTVAVFRGPMAHSPNIQAILMVVAVLLVVAGFIGLAFRITEGRAADLPKGVAACTIYRARIFPWIRRTSVLLLVTSGAALLVPSEWVALPLTIGGLVMLVGTAVIYPMYLKARHFDRGMSVLIADPWVHWKFSPVEWESWAAIQRSWERANAPVFILQRDWSKLLFPMAVFGGGAWVLDDSGTLEKVAVFLGCVVVLLLLAGLLTWVARGEPERRYRRMLAATPEAYLGADGFYCGGEYSPWSLAGHFLVEAAAVLDPPVRLVLTFDTVNGNSTTPLARLIPIPAGGEDQLPVLQQRLDGRYPEAAISLGTPLSRAS